MTQDRTETEKTTPAPAPSPFPREQTLIWVLWFTYGAFYFCRTNLAAASPGLQTSLESGGLGLSKGQIGDIQASLKIAYGLGQALNGQLSERISPRRLLALGMLCSAALNVLFGLSSGFHFLLFVWACNGYCQSLGWTPCMRVAANWIPVLRRGRAIGVIGTGYQVTQGLTYVVAGFSAQFLGWQGALFVPAGLLVAAAVFMLLFLEESPDQSSPRNQTTGSTGSGTGERSGSFIENLLLTLSNPGLWVLGISLGLLNACRFGYVDWGLTHLKEVQESGIGEAGVKYFFLPAGAVAGVYLAGWATDRFFSGRRAPVICLFLLALAGLTPLYHTAARYGGSWVIPLLIVIGFCIFGPQVLLVGTAPADLARRGTSAAAAGFVNFLGYMGAAAGDAVTGRILDNENWGWQVAIYVWAGWALAAAFFAALLWNATARTDHH